MAIQNFIQGTVRGKIGGHIGGSWKNKKTQRAYPDKVHDAHSESQVTVRDNFRAVTDVAKAINDVWSKKYFGKLKNMSGYNNFVKNQKGKMNASDFSPAEIQFPQSYLGAPIAPSSTPTVADGTVSVAMPAPTELALGTPSEYLVAVYDPKNKIAVAKAVTAEATTVSLLLPVAPVAGDKIYVYTQAGDGTRVNFSTATEITVA